MKKVILSVLLCASMILTMGASVFAAGSGGTGEKVMFNGSYLDFADAKPFSAKGRVFVPADEFFAHIGGGVSYDTDKNSVTASFGSTSVTFTAGSNIIEVSTAGESSKVPMDTVASVVNGVFFVPVRYAAGCVGISAGWDAAEGAVVLIDYKSISSTIDKKFSILNELMTVSVNEKKTYSNKGTFDMDMTVAEGDTTVPVQMNGTVDMLTRGTDASGNMSMSLNIKEILDMMPEEEKAAMTEEDKEDYETLTALLSEMSIDMIINSAESKYYIKSAMLDKVFEKMLKDKPVEGGSWYMLDMKELYASLGLTDEMFSEINERFSISSLSGLTLGNLVAGLMTAMPIESTYQYAVINEVIAIIEGIIGDKAFKCVNNADGSVTYSYVTDNDKLTSALTSAIANSPALMAMIQEQTIAAQKEMELYYKELGPILYEQAVEDGMSPQQAQDYVKEITVGLTSASSGTDMTSMMSIPALPDFTINCSVTIKDKHTYSQTLEMSMNVADETDEDNYIALTLSLASDIPGDTAMKMTAAMKTYGTEMTIKMNMDLNMSETVNGVTAAPAADASVINLFDLFTTTYSEETTLAPAA